MSRPKLPKWKHHRPPRQIMDRLHFWGKSLMEFALMTGYRPETLYLEVRRLAKQRTKSRLPVAPGHVSVKAGGSLGA